MPERFDLLLIFVVIAAFVAGYLIVGFVIKQVKSLKDKPPLNEHYWREEEEKAKQRQQR